MRAGACAVDVTPGPGLTLSGFAARTAPAVGTHDPLTARAVAVDDTALAVCDVLGLDAATTSHIRERCVLPAERVVVAALHTHGAPEVMPGRIGVDVSAAFLSAVEDGCVRAIDGAVARRRPCALERGSGAPPDIARNRRRAGGQVDGALPVLRLVDVRDRAVIATVVGYACHPVVLGADNLRYTADYPHAVREALERAQPGSVALFVTGAAADANSGHAARDSLSLEGAPGRTFEEALRIGERIARHALDASLSPSRLERVDVAVERVRLALARREPAPLSALVDRWRTGRERAGTGERALLDRWIDWAQEIALPDEAAPPSVGPVGPAVAGPVCRTALLRWGDATLVALPGEIFAATACELRARLADPDLIVVGYADDNPGYLPPPDELPRGGYEVDEAHRYYRQPATFAPDSVERLLASVDRLAAAVPARPT